MIRLAAIDMRGSDYSDRSPMGVLLEPMHGMGLDYRYLDEVEDGDPDVKGWRAYISRFVGDYGLTNMIPFWRGTGAILDWARTENMEGFFPSGDVLLTPREWMARLSYRRGWQPDPLGFFVAKPSVTVDDIFEAVVLGRGGVESVASDVDIVAIRKQLPSYGLCGWREHMPKVMPGQIVQEVLPPDDPRWQLPQALATLDMLRQGICGYRWDEDVWELQTLRVPESPEAEIAEAWEEQDAHRRLIADKYFTPPYGL